LKCISYMPSTTSISDEQLVAELLAAMKSAEPFPISLDDVSRWLLYRIRQRLVTILLSKFTRGLDYIEQESDDKGFKDDYKQYSVTTECFERFCKFRKGNRGRKVHVLFLQAKENFLESCIAQYDDDLDETPNEDFDSNENLDVLPSPEILVKQEPQHPEVILAPEIFVGQLPVVVSTGKRKVFHDNREETDIKPGRRIICKAGPDNIVKISYQPSAVTPLEDKLRTSTQRSAAEAEEIAHYHKRHMEELERIWLQQNAKIQRVMEQIDSPPTESFWQVDDYSDDGSPSEEIASKISAPFLPELELLELPTFNEDAIGSLFN